MPKIEFLFWEDCPSHERALERLQAAMVQVGLQPETIEVREVKTLEDAKREGFVGSPTIRVDGSDIFDVGEDPPSLTCRVYRRRDGRFSPLPDPEDLLDAMKNAGPG